MKLKTIYKRFKAWWRMRQYVKELKSNTDPFRWGTRKKHYDKTRPFSIGTLISNVTSRSSKPDIEI